MYLEKVKAKNRYYLYLKMYDASITYARNKKITLYSFGRIDKAVSDMCKWYNDMNSLPDDLKRLGCTRDDIYSWMLKTKSQSINKLQSAATG